LLLELLLLFNSAAWASAAAFCAAVTFAIFLMFNVVKIHYNFRSFSSSRQTCNLYQYVF
jgi:hypothetical protein